MSQQEMSPQFQENDRTPQDNEQYRWRPFQRPSGSKGRDVPKSEHPSTYEENFVPPYSYQEQNEAARRPTGSEHREYRERREHWRHGRFSPDGDALENGYRPYHQHNNTQVPWWARPQRSSIRPWRILGFLVLGLLLIKPMLALLGLLFVLGAAFVILLVLLTVVALGVLAFLGLPIGGWFLFKRRRRMPWGGPWGWY